MRLLFGEKMEYYTYFHINRYGKRELCLKNEIPINLGEAYSNKQEVYSSYFHYDDSILTYSREHNGSLEGYTPVLMGADKLIFDLDSSAIEDSYNEAQTLVSKFKDYDIDPSVWFSGSKGFHIEIPSVCFGGFEPHKELHLIHKKIAESVAVDLGLTTIDLKIYSSMRSIRHNYSYHESGKKKYGSDCYKVPVNIFDPLEDIIRSSSKGIEQRRNVYPSKLVSDFEKAKKSAYATYKDSASIDKFTHKPLSKIDITSRHNTIISKAVKFANNDIHIKDAIDFIYAFNNSYFDVPHDFNEIQKQVSYVYANYKKEQNVEDFSSMKEALLKHKEEVLNPEVAAKTHWKTFDEAVQLKRGRFVVVGAKSEVGKTTLYANMAHRLAHKDKKHSTIISLEMPESEIAGMVASIHLQQGEDLISDGIRTQTEAFFSLEEVEEIENLPIKIFRSRRRIDEQVLDELITTLKGEDPDLHTVFIDYLGCISWSKGGDKSSELPQYIKNLAIRHGICVVALAQVRKFRGKKELTKWSQLIPEDIKDSSELINASDDIVLLWRGKGNGNECIYGKKGKSRHNRRANGMFFVFNYIGESKALICDPCEEADIEAETMEEYVSGTKYQKNDGELSYIQKREKSYMPSKKENRSSDWDISFD